MWAWECTEWRDSRESGYTTPSAYTVCGVPTLGLHTVAPDCTLLPYPCPLPLPRPLHLHVSLFLTTHRYALAAEVGSHHLRVGRDGPAAVATGLSSSSSLGGGVGFRRGFDSGDAGGGGGGGGDQPAAVAASKPWGCTALEGLFLDGQGVVSVLRFVSLGLHWLGGFLLVFSFPPPPCLFSPVLLLLGRLCFALLCFCRSPSFVCSCACLHAA